MGTSISSDQAGNIYVSGNTSYFSGGGGAGGSYSYDILWKLNPAGDILWTDSLGMINTRSVSDPNGNVYAVSDKLQKYNSSGQNLWSLNLGSHIYLNNIALNPAGGVVAVGMALIAGRTQSVLSYYDASGNLIWNRIDDFAAGGSTPNAIICDNSGNTYWVGQSVQNDTAIGFLAKVDLSGNLLSTTTIPNEPTDIALGSDNSIYVIGQFSSEPITINGSSYQSSNREYYYIKYDQIMNVLWYKIITGQLWTNSIVTDDKGNSYLGITNTSISIDSFSASNGGFCVVKLDRTGTVQWLKQSVYTASFSSAHSRDINITSNDEIIVTGTILGHNAFDDINTTSTGSYTNVLVAKISPTVAGITSSSLSIQDLNIYPNPTQGIFQLSYNCTEVKEIKISIYNSAGKTIYFEAVEKPSANLTRQFDLSKESKGSYFIEIIADGKRSVRKVVIN